MVSVVEKKEFDEIVEKVELLSHVVYDLVRVIKESDKLVLGWKTKDKINLACTSTNEILKYFDDRNKEIKKES